MFFWWEVVCFSFLFCFLKSSSSWSHDQLTIISLVTCAAQLWHFVSTLLSQHLALIHPNNYCRHFWDDWFFTSERHLFWYANSNKWERGLQEYRMKLNAKINVTFQSIMTEKIHINRLFFEETYLLPPCMYLFVCHKDLNMTLSTWLDTNWPICRINNSYSQRIKYPNMPLHIRGTSRKQTNISRSQQGIHDKLGLQNNYDIPKGKCTSLANYP